MIFFQKNFNQTNKLNKKQNNKQNKIQILSG